MFELPPDFIATAETDIQIAGLLANPSPITWASYICELAHRMPPPAIIQERGQVFASIVLWRWVVDCPFCRSAIVASKLQPSFWCIECRMTANGGYYMSVVFPTNAADIEKVLLARPTPVTRNWLLAETLNDLIRENRENGIGA